MGHVPLLVAFLSLQFLLRLGAAEPREMFTFTQDPPSSPNTLPNVSQTPCMPDPLESVYVVHWTHVPKAGGTAFAELAKQAACKMNPHLRDTNPCCRKRLCLAPRQSCAASASSCPFVTGIGRHSSNMNSLLGVPCCGTALVMVSSIHGFANYAIRTSNDFKEPHFQLWPFEDRVRFLKLTGVSQKRIVDRMSGMNPPLPGSQLRDLLSLAASTPSPFARRKDLTDHMTNCVRNLLKSKCCGKTPGSNSLTMLRHPYMRAISGFFYRGHSPNFDAYSLRPGVFTRAMRRTESWIFQDYIGLPEYTNVMTKMFGASKYCDFVTRCQRGPCVLTGGCHVYRNASYLTQTHLHLAKEALDLHNFVGILEAYKSSILLMTSIYDLEVEKDQFRKERVSKGKSCGSELSVLRLQNDEDACLKFCRLNALDLQLYAHAHRSFCQRLELFGLRDNPVVIKELKRSSLCTGQVDFGDPEDYCRRLHTAEKADKVAKLEKKCHVGGKKKK